MKKLPSGIQSIQEILSNGYIYVDKTELAYKLISGDKHYFISRPRRFGKSLFVSTLEEIFTGSKELFKECSIYKSSYDWQPHPVFHFDFSLIAHHTPEALRKGLEDVLEDIATKYGLSISGSSLQSQLTRLVKASSSKLNQVVVLVDEYDKPIVSHLADLETAKQNRDLLRDFFGTLKGLDAHIRFTFITGVSKFSQVSLFSGLNNLNDITMNEDFAGMLGYTDEEVQKYFVPHMEAIISKRGSNISKNDLLNEIRMWYNGYRFSSSPTSVYNPFSTLNFMKSGSAKSYWYRTGTPSFLIQQIKKQPESAIPLSGAAALEGTLSDISSLERINLTALMFQTGYLTITDYDDDSSFYYLDFPNLEVRSAFFNSLLEDFVQIDPTNVIKNASQVQQALESQDIKTFISIMNSHFGKIAYPLFANAQEGFYSAILLTFLERSGIKISAEVMTNIGRIDLVADLEKTTYVFELKLDKTADIALDQATTQKYREKHLHSTKEILVVGINFSSETRNIAEHKAQLFSPTGKLIKELNC